MGWVLVVILTWAASPPATVLQVPMKTEVLCKEASKRVYEDFDVNMLARSLGSGGTKRFTGILTTCLQVQ